MTKMHPMTNFFRSHFGANLTPLQEENVLNAYKKESCKKKALLYRLIHGNLIVKDKHGMESSKTNAIAFCRCGHSNNKPYCDGSHNKFNFQD